MVEKMKLVSSFILCIFHLLMSYSGAREVKELSGSWDFSYETGDVVSVTVPHTWNVRDAADGPAEDAKNTPLSVQGKDYKRGAGLYMKELPVKPQAKKRYFVRFEGVSITAEVDVNGTVVGQHEGAFTAFCFEITKQLKKDKNTLLVKADNTFREHILPLSGVFSMFGGIYRPVSIIETPLVCIRPDYLGSPGIFIKQGSITSESASLEIKSLLSAADSEHLKATKLNITASVLDAAGKEVSRNSMDQEVTPGEWELTQKVEIPAPILWQGRENPYLYTVRVTLKTDDGQTDQVSQPLGIRMVSIDPEKGFILNGKAMNLKAVCRHQDKQGKGWAVSAKDEEEDIKMILEMGADALRTAHYPQSRNIYELCNKAGFIVWSEVPAVERVWDTPEFIENMNLQATEMVLQLGNNPCLAMWGIFNEIYHNYDKRMDGVEVLEVLRGLNALIKTLDDRPTVAATNRVDNKELNMIPDHIAINVYPGWYGGGPSGMAGYLDSFPGKYPDQGTAISEYGHGGSIHHHEEPCKQPPPSGYWHPEEWQSLGHEGNYKEIKNRHRMWGAYIWNMFDFASDARKEGDCEGINDKGLVTYDRKTRKDAFYFYKANWNNEPMVYLTSRRFTKRTKDLVTVKAYSNADSVELVVNGKSVGDKKNPDDLKRVQWEEVKLRPGKNTILVKAVRGNKKIQDTCIWTYTVLKEKPETEKYDALKDGNKKRGK